MRQNAPKSFGGRAAPGSDELPESPGSVAGFRERGEEWGMGMDEREGKISHPTVMYKSRRLYNARFLIASLSLLRVRTP